MRKESVFVGLVARSNVCRSGSNGACGSIWQSAQSEMCGSSGDRYRWLLCVCVYSAHAVSSVPIGASGRGVAYGSSDPLRPLHECGAWRAAGQ